LRRPLRMKHKPTADGLACNSDQLRTSNTSASAHRLHTLLAQLMPAPVGIEPRLTPDGAAFAAWFRPAGMARAMPGVATMQALLGIAMATALAGQRSRRLVAGAAVRRFFTAPAASIGSQPRLLPSLAKRRGAQSLPGKGARAVVRLVEDRS